MSKVLAVYQKHRTLFFLAAFAALILAKMASVYVPIIFKNMIDALTPTENVTLGLPVASEALFLALVLHDFHRIPDMLAAQKANKTR